jgi:hypothetical protein
MDMIETRRHAGDTDVREKTKRGNSKLNHFEAEITKVIPRHPGIRKNIAETAGKNLMPTMARASGWAMGEKEPGEEHTGGANQ